MKQPTAPNLYPELPIEDGQNYTLQNNMQRLREH